MLTPILAVIVRDLRLALRRRSDIASVLFFFIIVVSLFPLGVGPEPEQLRKLAPGVLWVAALLATMLSLPRLFADDYRDGTLEQLALALVHEFGTVWGIYHALVAIGISGQAALEKVAGPVGEALIMTAAGLAVALTGVHGVRNFRNLGGPGRAPGIAEVLAAIAQELRR